MGGKKLVQGYLNLKVELPMKKNEFDVPVDWGKLSSHKPAIHSKSDKQIYWAKIRMASKKKKFNIDKELNEMKDNKQISLCTDCYCMTHTINGKCGKCGARKEKHEL